MTFSDCDEAIKGGMYLRLEDDGEQAKAVFVGEPVPREGKFKGKPRTQYCFPVVTENGLCVWTIGVRLYKVIRDAWPSFVGKCQSITRHGPKDSTDTKYTFRACKPTAAIQAAFDDLEPGEIEHILEAAVDIQE